MNCNECYKFAHRFRGRRRCNGRLRGGCGFFIPHGPLFIWNEQLHILNRTESGEAHAERAEGRGRVGPLALTIVRK